MATQLTVVLFALRREAKPFLRRLRGAVRVRGLPCPSWRAEDLLVVVTGMGPAAIERELTWVLNLRPGRVITAGYCGSLVPECRIGHLIAPQRVVDSAGDAWPLARPANLPTSGTLVSVAAPVLGVRDRSELHLRTGADVVDMETATVARRCQEARIPCHGLRVVSDDFEHPLPAEVVSGSLWWGLARRPSLVGDLWRLARDTRRASDILAETLQQLMTIPG